MNTIQDIGQSILETIRESYVVDDERLDLRLLYDWIDRKRAQYIKNTRSTNPNDRLNLNLYQTLDVTVEVAATANAGNYPFTTAVEDANIVQSTATIPTIIEDKEGPIILTLESEDLVKIPFSIVSYDQMRFSGNGRFNSGLIFGSIRDNKVYFKYNTFFDTYTNVKLRAIFESPRDVGDFDEDTDRYPADLGLIEYIKNGIMDKDIRMLFAGKADEINDATGEIKN